MDQTGHSKKKGAIVTSMDKGKSIDISSLGNEFAIDNDKRIH